MRENQGTNGRGFDKLAAGVEQALQNDYPEHLRAVGTESCTAVLQPVTILLRLATEAHQRFGTFALTGGQIEALLADVAAFFDGNTNPRMQNHARCLSASTGVEQVGLAIA